jgi:hypothetical protein
MSARSRSCSPEVQAHVHGLSTIACRWAALGCRAASDHAAERPPARWSRPVPATTLLRDKCCGDAALVRSGVMS